jgi:hypothetical protein
MEPAATMPGRFRGVGYLSEVARRRIAALLLVAGIVVAVLAIADTGPFEDPPTEEERVEATVEDFYAAATAGEFERYCSLLTQGARELVQRNAARLIEEAGRLSCKDIISVAAKSFEGLKLRIREVSVSGIRARVEADLKRPNVPGIESRTLYLERLDSGDWRITDPG